MQVQQVFNTQDVYYNRERMQVHRTLVDNQNRTYYETETYYYPLYTKKGVLEVPKGKNIDLKV
jgi:hypothetical protein